MQTGGHRRRQARTQVDIVANSGKGADIDANTDLHIGRKAQAHILTDPQTLGIRCRLGRRCNSRCRSRFRSRLKHKFRHILCLSRRLSFRRKLRHTRSHRHNITVSYRHIGTQKHRLTGPQILKLRLTPNANAKKTKVQSSTI